MKYLILIIIFLPSAVYAENNLPKGNITVNSDSMQYFSKQKYSAFRKNVVVASDSYTLKADAIDLYINGKNHVDKIICTGNVIFNTTDTKSSSKKAEIDELENLITLTGEVKIWKGKNYMEGEQVVINYKTEDITVNSPDRTRLILVPEEKE